MDKLSTFRTIRKIINYTEPPTTVFDEDYAKRLNVGQIYVNTVIGFDETRESRPCPCMKKK